MTNGHSANIFLAFRLMVLTVSHFCWACEIL